jgi:MFS family permease
MRPMVLLFIALFNSILGLSVLFPVLAPLGRDLGLDETQINALSTAYAFMQFAMSPVWGKQSESRGRKPILLIGILGFSAGFFAFAGVAYAGLHGLLEGGLLFALLLATRIFGGIFSAATLPSAQAYAADVSDRDKRTSTMALIGAAFGLGIIVGPAIGMAIVQLTHDMLAPVYFSASVALVNALFVALSLPEPARKYVAQSARNARSIARRLWPLLLVAFATTLASVAMEQTIAFYLIDRLGLAGEQRTFVVGLALTGYGVVAVLSQGLIVRRVGLSPRALLFAGLPVALAGFVLLVFARTPATLVGALLVQGLGQGLALPGVTAALSLGAGDDEQGSLAGWSSSAQGLGRTVGPILGGALYQLRSELPYVFSAALLALVLAFVLLGPKGTPRPAAAD